MQIAKSKKVEYASLMEEKVHEMSKELNDLRIREFVMKEQLQLENNRLMEEL